MQSIQSNRSSFALLYRSIQKLGQTVKKLFWTVYHYPRPIPYNKSLFRGLYSTIQYHSFLCMFKLFPHCHPSPAVIWSRQRNRCMIAQAMMTSFKKNTILLVNPWIHDFAAHDHWAKPMGLLYIASYLRRSGYDIDLLDCLSSSYGLRTQFQAPPLGRKGDGRGSYPREEISRPVELKGIPRKFSRYGFPPGIVEDRLKKLERPDLVLVTSFMTYWYPGVAETIGYIRARWKNVPVVLGGIYATLCPDHAKRNSGADVVIAGDGIAALPSILADFSAETPCSPSGR